MICPKGYFCKAACSSPEPCSPGFYSDSTGRSAEYECLLCKPGNYSARAGMTSCDQCLAGTYANGNGLAECTACPRGSYMDSDKIGSSKATDCRICPINFYNPTLGGNSSTACQKCPQGTYSTASGGTSQNVCRTGPCKPGFETNRNGNASCTPCVAGKFQTRFGFDPCSPCPANTYRQLLLVKQHPVKAVRIALPRALHQEALLQRLVAYLVHPEQLHLMVIAALHA